MKDPSAFIKTTAAFFLAFSILCLLGDLFCLIFFHFWMHGDMSYGNFGMGPFQEWRMSHLGLYYGFHTALSLSGVVCSSGMLARKPWALRAFTVLLGILILFHLANLGFAVSAMATLPENVSANGIPIPGRMVMFSLGIGAFGAGVMSGLYGWLWVLFKKKEVVKVFK